MRKKIISIGIISMFLLTGFLSINAFGLEIKKEKASEESTDADMVIVKIHAFYDINGNGIHDTDPINNEGDAEDFIIHSVDEFLTILDFRITYKGRTDENGYFSIEVERNNEFFAVWVQEKWGDYDQTQWRSESYGGYRDPVDTNEDVNYLEIPLTYYEKKVKVKNPFISSIFLRIFKQLSFLDLDIF